MPSQYQNARPALNKHHALQLKQTPPSLSSLSACQARVYSSHASNQPAHHRSLEGCNSTTREAGQTKKKNRLADGIQDPKMQATNEAEKLAINRLRARGH